MSRRATVCIGILILVVLPPASADDRLNIIDTLIVELGPGFQMSVSCLAPGYVDCSTAGTFTAGKCVDVPLKGQVCVSAGSAFIGGLSQVAGQGGVAFGSSSIWTGPYGHYCSWQGTSGACVDVAFDAAFACNGMSATSTLVYVRYAVVPSVYQATLNAPNSHATAAGGCATLATSSVPGDATPGDVEAALEEALRVDLTEKLDAAQGSLAVGTSPEVQALLDSVFVDLHKDVSAFLSTLSVSSEYEATWNV